MTYLTDGLWSDSSASCQISLAPSMAIQILQQYLAWMECSNGSYYGVFSIHYVSLSWLQSLFLQSSFIVLSRCLPFLKCLRVDSPAVYMETMEISNSPSNSRQRLDGQDQIAGSGQANTLAVVFLRSKKQADTGQMCHCIKE